MRTDIWSHIEVSVLFMVLQTPAELEFSTGIPGLSCVQFECFWGKHDWDSHASWILRSVISFLIHICFTCLKCFYPTFQYQETFKVASLIKQHHRQCLARKIILKSAKMAIERSEQTHSQHKTADVFVSILVRIFINAWRAFASVPWGTSKIHARRST